MVRATLTVDPRRPIHDLDQGTAQVDGAVIGLGNTGIRQQA
jgi:hypothetical protein